MPARNHAFRRALLCRYLRGNLQIIEDVVVQDTRMQRLGIIGSRLAEAWEIKQSEAANIGYNALGGKNAGKDIGANR